MLIKDCCDDDDINMNININKKQIKIFDETLEYINFQEIELLTNKINQLSHHSSFENSIKTEQSIFLQKNENNFPYYIGSFKHSLNRFLRNNENKDIRALYDSILKEIKKIYYGYTHVEQKMYSKINQFIKFKDEENNTPLEIISKLKEIEETLKETIKFVEVYLYLNFKYLKVIFRKIDNKLYQKIGVKSVSLYFLLDIFELPNNELSYILMFKIIDEVSCILKYITDNLSETLKKENTKSKNNLNNFINNNNKKDSQSNLLESQLFNSSIAVDAINKVNDQYVKKIYGLLNKLDRFNFFRAKYYNKYLYTRGDFEIDTNRYLYKSNTLDDNNEEYLQINTLMDEELIISKFLGRTLINEFLNFFEAQLIDNFRRNKKLIYLHSIQYNIISVLIIYSFSNYYQGFIEAPFFYIGRLIGKFFFNHLIKNRFKMKLLLLISNFISIISLIIIILDNYENNYIWLNCISKLIIGVCYYKNIETIFIFNYTPKLLIKRNIKKYFRIKYLSIALGFFLLTCCSHLQSLFNNQIKIDLIFASVISLIILIINFLFFKEPKLEDIINLELTEHDNKKKIDNKAIEEENIINNTLIEDKLNSSDNITNISYGKVKIISLKERNKVKIMENYLRLGKGKGDYEGTNHIFSILQELIVKENFNYSSYTNYSITGHILFLTFLYIIFSVIIFYNPLINSNKVNDDENDKILDLVLDFKKKIWIFGLSYLLYYLLLIIKFFSRQKDLSSWNFILLLYILFQILFVLLFIILDKNIFSVSPIYFDNYFYISFYSVILLFVLIIEKRCYKIMIREIPLEATIIRGINIDNFLDVYENFIKAITFIIFFAINYFKFTSNYDYATLIPINSFLFISLIIFIIFNYKRKQFSLIKIINKITYESF